jgi:gliding motility-associated-like protein
VLWYPFADSCQGVESLSIYGKENDLSPYKLIGTANPHNQFEYYQANGSSFQYGSYFLKYVLDCNGQKTVYSDTQRVDVFAPAVIDPDSVSVGAAGDVIMGWTQGKDKDTKSYVIYYVQGNVNNIIDTVVGRGSTFYVDKKKGNPLASGVRYKLAAQDSCGNIAPIGNYHQTVFLSATQDSCLKEVTLKWSSYVGWKEGVSDYEVFYSLDSSKGYTRVALVQGNSYVFKNALNDQQYYFFIRAHKNADPSFTSSSNRISLVTQFQKPIGYVYLKHVSVKNNKLELDWAVSNSREIDYFVIRRGKAEDADQEFTRVQGTAALEYSFDDSTADVEKDIFYYRIQVYNTCGQLSGTSNISHNIIVSLRPIPGGRHLEWNAYDGWDGGVGSYEIDRIISNSSSWQPVGTVSKDQLMYEDRDSLEVAARPGICYRIKAIEAKTNRYGFQENSLSNEECYLDPPIVFVPNAFNPVEGFVNTVFKPSVVNADTTASTMDIYNKWGERIYSTTNISKGWDGKLSGGQFAPSDGYMYVINVYGLDRSYVRLKGTFSLL